MSEKIVSKYFTLTQLCFWNQFVKPAFLYPKQKLTIYGIGNTKVCKIYDWAERNKLNAKRFLIHLMKHTGKDMSNNGSSNTARVTEDITMYDAVYSLSNKIHVIWILFVTWLISNKEIYTKGLKGFGIIVMEIYCLD